MPSVKTLLLVVALTALTGCGQLTTLSTPLAVKPPANLLRKAEKLERLAPDANMGASARHHQYVIQEYNALAVRHNELIAFEAQRRW